MSDVTASVGSDYQPDAVAVPVATTPQDEPNPTPAPAAPSVASPVLASHRPAHPDSQERLRHLPPYAKSLLKVRVPVTVSLATTKYPLKQILELGPGSLIQFNKSCEDNLTLEVGGRTIAEGEAVKVGDKFGLWITAMTMPGERFWVVHGQRSGARVK